MLVNILCCVAKYTMNLNLRRLCNAEGREAELDPIKLDVPLQGILTFIF